MATLVSIIVQNFPHKDEELVEKAVSDFLRSLATRNTESKAVQNGGFVTADVANFWRGVQTSPAGDTPRNDTSPGFDARLFSD
jgi:hypothetical protein